MRIDGTIREANHIAIIIGFIIVFLVHNTQAQEVNGTPGCLCLTPEELNKRSNETYVDLEETLGLNIDISTYGIGCHAHDEESLSCSHVNDCTRIIPVPLGCDKSFCPRSWCFVDENCPLHRRPSKYFKDRHYSYATCGELDSFTFTDRLKSLNGEVFNVGFASNSGGWKGSFNPSGSFTIDNKWEGPIVEFVEEAAKSGGFSINMTAPPAWLKPMSGKFFGSSSFDYCVYATSLGFLDFCVGGFSITEKRSSVTTMFETTSDPYYLIVFTEDDGGTNWDSFRISLVSLFQPFTGRAWVLILFGFLPFLGCLMFFHEYGAPGSSYPTSEPVMVQRQDGTVEAQTRQISLVKNIVNALYTGIHSLFNGSFDLAVVTPGGKMGLLAVSFFIMIILAVYTANLAAILTQSAQKTSVDSIESAIKAGYNFCAERKLAQIIIDSYGVSLKQVVPDPVDIGGDGEPGFNCPDCNARERIFEYMRRSHTDGSLYCNAAISKIEDLQIMHNFGNHCDKVKVGDALGYQTIGIPIFEDSAPQLMSIFHKVKNEGAMTKALVAATPESQCPVLDEEGTALDIPELTGVWVVTSAFALLSLFVKCIFVFCRGSERGLRRYDQWLNLAGNDVVVGGYRFDSETNELLLNENDGNDDINMEEGSAMIKAKGLSSSSSNLRVVRNDPLCLHQDDEKETTKSKDSSSSSVSSDMVVSKNVSLLQPDYEEGNVDPNESLPAAGREMPINTSPLKQNFHEKKKSKDMSNGNIRSDMDEEGILSLQQGNNEVETNESRDNDVSTSSNMIEKIPPLQQDDEKKFKGSEPSSDESGNMDRNILLPQHQDRNENCGAIKEKDNSLRTMDMDKNDLFSRVEDTIKGTKQPGDSTSASTSSGMTKNSLPLQQDKDEKETEKIGDVYVHLSPLRQEEQKGATQPRDSSIIDHIATMWMNLTKNNGDDGTTNRIDFEEEELLQTKKNDVDATIKLEDSSISSDNTPGTSDDKQLRYDGKEQPLPHRHSSARIDMTGDVFEE